MLTFPRRLVHMAKTGIVVSTMFKTRAEEWFNMFWKFGRGEMLAGLNHTEVGEGSCKHAFERIVQRIFCR